MKKSNNILCLSLLTVLLGTALASCNTTQTSGSNSSGSGDKEPVGITKRPDNDFDNDPNRHDRTPVEKTLTLKGGATFKDGSTTKTILSGQELVVGEDILVTIPEGRMIVGWLADNPDDPNLYGDYYAGTNFTTIRKDATIQPIFDVPGEAYAPTALTEDGPKYGKLSGFAWEIRGDAPQTNQNAYMFSDTNITFNVGDEAGKYFHVGGGTKEAYDSEKYVPAGWHTLFLSSYEIAPDYSYGFTYKIQNYGDEAIDIKLYQTNSSTNVFNEKNSAAPVHLEPGEVDYAYTWIDSSENGNVLLTLQSLTAVKELKVGLCGYVEDYSKVKEQSLTITEGDIIENEASVGKTKNYKPGTQVTLKYENQDPNKIFIGWQDVNDENEIYPSTFNMPNKALNLKPYLEDKNAHKHTVTLGENLTFAEGGTTKELCWYDTLDLSTIQYSGEVKPGQKVVYEISYGGVVEEKTALDTFTMPDSDVTIKFLRSEVVYSTTNGKIGMAPFESDAPSNNPHKWRDSKSSMISLGDINISGSYAVTTMDCFASKGTINEEEASVFDLRGYKYSEEEGKDEILDTISKDSIFMMQSNHTTYAGTYNDVATVQNLGEKAITIKIAMSQSSGDFDAGGISEAVTIQPGEVANINFTTTFTKENSSEMISIQYAGEEAIESMKLAMYIYRSPKK